jgi:secreted trypsin-like serine protease
MKFVGILLLLIFIHSFVCEKNKEKNSDGTEAPVNAFPWMVSIRLNFVNVFMRDCGGVIVSDIFILTASSCFQDMALLASFFTIKAGIHKIGGESEATEQARSISSLLPHPNYTSNFFLNDLVLIRVSSPFDFNSSSVSPISLSNLTSLENMDLITAGWGPMNPSAPTGTAIPLQQVTVKENIQCTQNKSTNPMIQLCVTGNNFLLFKCSK